MAALPSGTVYVGGDFTSVTVGMNSSPRRGVASFDAGGNLLPWDASVIGTTSGETVRVLMLDDTTSNGQLWVGGKFTGVPHVGQQDLTPFTRAWHITTPSLTAAQEGQIYGPVQITTTENLPCTWSLYTTGAPWLQIDPAGVITSSAPCPVGLAGLMYYEVIATSAQGAARRWFLLTILPAPPPTLLSITGPGAVYEGAGPLVTPAPQIVLSLNQAFGADVEVDLQYIDGSAHVGYDYASAVTHKTIPAGTLSVSLPLSIFGDSVPGVSQRTFTIRISTPTANVSVSPAASQHVVTILDDDAPVAQHAIAWNLGVFESQNEMAQINHVKSNQPLFKWDFRSDFAAESQSDWQVQVSDKQDFSGAPVWDSAQQPGAATEVQMGSVGAAVFLMDGQAYFVRVRVWSTGASAAGAWIARAFRTNTPPPPAMGMSPGLAAAPYPVVLTARPALTWATAHDADGERLNFKVELTQVGGSGALSLRSEISPQIFEWRPNPTASWQTMASTGVLGPCEVRVTVPASVALAADDWLWTVTLSDGYELSTIAGPLGFNVDPHYAVGGSVTDASGVTGDPGRTVSVYSEPGHLLLGTAVTQSNGDFTVALSQVVAPGTVLAVLIDNPNPLPAHPEFAACFVRFGGSDLTELTGNNRQVKLRHGTLLLDSRGHSPLEMGMLAPPTPLDPDWPCQVAASGLELTSRFLKLEVMGDFLAQGVTATPGAPVSLCFPGGGVAQVLEVAAGGSLVVCDGASIDVQVLSNLGAMTLESGAHLKLRSNSETEDRFLMHASSVLELDHCNLRVIAGTATFGAASILGLASNQAVIVEGGMLSADGTIFDRVHLQVDAGGDIGSVSAVKFQGGPINQRIVWNRVQGTGATMHGIRFDANATYNVYAGAGADQLNLVGCGGDGSGESHDFDPGEATSTDIVKWILGSLNGFTLRAGDARALVMWDAGAQQRRRLHLRNPRSGIVHGSFRAGWNNPELVFRR